MVTISPLMFTLLAELLVILTLTLLLWVFFTLRRRRRDRDAARKLVDQVRHQSTSRQQETNSFLHEKYRFEGDDLDKAVQAIDRSEKKFIQRFINIYLQRDADALVSLDAAVAEMIDSYKNLTPIMADAESLPSAETVEQVKTEAARQVEQVRQENQRLGEELEITKQTMSDMIAEFGNMFGGGADHELAKHEVIRKMEEKNRESGPEQAASPDPQVNEIDLEEGNQDAPTTISATDPAAQPTGDKVEATEVTETSAINESSDQQNKDSGQVVSEDDIENLLNDIELTAEK